jgi:Winged helix-turn helix
LVGWVREQFGIVCCRETIRAALHRLDLSWKKAKKLLGRADPARRQAFIERVQVPSMTDIFWSISTRRTSIKTSISALAGRGERFWVASHSPGLSAKLSFYGLYLYNEGQVRLWSFPRANGEHTIEVLRRLRTEWPDHPLIVLWDGASYHRAASVRSASDSSRCRVTAPI